MSTEHEAEKDVVHRFVACHGVPFASSASAMVSGSHERGLRSNQEYPEE